MNTPALPLASTQAWMQAVLVHPDGVERGLSSREARGLLAPEDAPRVIRERGDLTATERLQIYAGMYPLRMVEALRGDYPALAAFLGEECFETLVGEYVAAHPSRSFTLARLGDRLPEFVAGWGPGRCRGLAVDIGRLEHAATAVFDAEDVPPLDSSVFRQVAAADHPHLRLVPAPAFRLVAVRPGAIDVLDAVLEGAPVPRKTGRGRVTVVYYRQDFVVRRRTLGVFEGNLLASLNKGETFGAALESAAAISPGGFPSAKALSEWFEDWTRRGFFARVEAATPVRGPDLPGLRGIPSLEETTMPCLNHSIEPASFLDTATKGKLDAPVRRRA